MSDEIKTGETDNQDQQDIKKPDVKKEDVKKDGFSNIEDIDKLKEILRKEASRNDRLQTEFNELKKTLEVEKKKSLSEKEIKELEQRELKDKLDFQAKENQMNALAIEKSKLLFRLQKEGNKDNGLQWDDDFLEMVHGNTIEEFQDNINKLNAKVKKMVENAVNMKLSQGNPPPVAGKGADDVFTLDEIEKHRGDQSWFSNNYDKIKKSMNYWSNKTN